MSPDTARNDVIGEFPSEPQIIHRSSVEAMLKQSSTYRQFYIFTQKFQKGSVATRSFAKSLFLDL